MHIKSCIPDLMRMYFKEFRLEDLESLLECPQDAWVQFCDRSSFLDGEYASIEFEITNIIKDLINNERVACQYCRLDNGLSVQPPLRAENLCKRHLQIYEENYIDRVKTWRPNGIYWEDV